MNYSFFASTLVVALSLAACTAPPDSLHPHSQYQENTYPAIQTRNKLGTNTEAPRQAVAAETDSLAAIMPAQQREQPALKLQISQPWQAPANDLPQQQADTAQSLFKPVTRDDRLKLSGKLHLDDTEPGYVEAIEGAEVNIEIKFR